MRAFIYRSTFCGALVSLVAVSSFTLGGCDSRESTHAKSDGGRDRPVSIFPSEDPVARQIQGVVLLGTEPVTNASIRLEPSSGTPWEVRLSGEPDPFLVSTDLGGHYRFASGPIPYDLAVRKDREVVVFRGLSHRFFDPSLGHDATVRGFTGAIAATTDPAPAPGNAVAFMIEGENARALSGDAGSLVATFRRFDTIVTLRAIEYVPSPAGAPAAGGLAGAVRSGKVNVLVHDGGAAVAVVPTVHETAATVNDIRFIVRPPAGFALTAVEVVMDFGLRTAARTVATVAAGTPLRLAIVAEARYFARVRAARDGATSDSGLQAFDPALPSMALTLPPPLPEAAYHGGGFSVATTKGVVEHVLVPAGPGGVSLRLATAAATATLPDLEGLGVPRLRGTYSWTVHHFATLQHVDDLGGEDGRVVNPVSVTPPRLIELP